jgi:threonine/homoserine/homoserine lactone efflux protein
MTVSTHLLYLAAVTLLVITPGPTMLMCAANALNHGPMRAMASVAGALTASLAVMGLSAVGLGALLAASATAFTLLKIAGAAYLIWLGIRMVRGSAPPLGEAPAARSRSLFAQGLLVGASNPKAVLFFAAFFSQFIDAAQPVLPQFMLLSLTFVTLDALMLATCAVGVGRIAPLLRETKVVHWINRVCGGLFTLLGGLLLLSRRPA